MNYRATINGIEVNANYSEENIKDIFIPLLEKFRDMQNEKGSRILVFLAAPPGAGKTTLLSFLKYLAGKIGIEITSIGMDGFHRYQGYLLTHSLIRDGKEIKMVEVKGAPETFDTKKLIERVKKVAAGENCGWPDYNRMTHNPNENAVTVRGNIVLLEGNYLLLKREGWSELKKYADFTISVKADEGMLYKRLLERKIKSGNSEEKARKFVEFSDIYNVRTCLNESESSDLTLELLADGSYSLQVNDNKMEAENVR